jgi:hypothetical protein
MTRRRAEYCDQEPNLAARAELDLAEVVAAGKRAWAWRAVYEELADVLEPEQPRPGRWAPLS